MSTPLPGNPPRPDFAAIRTLCDRQVLAWVECSHEDICLHCQFQFRGASADMKTCFGEDGTDKSELEVAEAKAYATLERFKAGELDAMLSEWIASTEADFATEEETNE